MGREDLRPAEGLVEPGHGLRSRRRLTRPGISAPAGDLGRAALGRPNAARCKTVRRRSSSRPILPASSSFLYQAGGSVIDDGTVVIDSEETRRRSTTTTACTATAWRRPPPTSARNGPATRSPRTWPHRLRRELDVPVPGGQRAGQAIPYRRAAGRPGRQGDDGVHRLLLDQRQDRGRRTGLGAGQLPDRPGGDGGVDGPRAGDAIAPRPRRGVDRQVPGAGAYLVSGEYARPWQLGPGGQAFYPGRQRDPGGGLRRSDRDPGRGHAVGRGRPTADIKVT